MSFYNPDREYLTVDVVATAATEDTAPRSLVPDQRLTKNEMQAQRVLAEVLAELEWCPLAPVAEISGKRRGRRHLSRVGKRAQLYYQSRVESLGKGVADNAFSDFYQAALRVRDLPQEPAKSEAAPAPKTTPKPAPKAKPTPKTKTTAKPAPTAPAPAPQSKPTPKPVPKLKYRTQKYYKPSELEAQRRAIVGGDEGEIKAEIIRALPKLIEYRLKRSRKSKAPSQVKVTISGVLEISTTLRKVEPELYRKCFIAVANRLAKNNLLVRHSVTQRVTKKHKYHYCLSPHVEDFSTELGKAYDAEIDNLGRE